MINPPISFSFAGLPIDYCFTGYARFALDITAAMEGYVQGDVGFLITGSDEPDAEDRNKMWDRLFPDGSPDRIYHFFGGNWVARNPRAPGTNERIWWDGTESDLWSHDGGDGADPTTSPPTATTGAMWVRDTNYNAKFPLQAGTLENTEVVAPGDVGGTSLLQEHSHVVGRFESGGNLDSMILATGSSTSAAIGQFFNEGEVGGSNGHLTDFGGNYIVTTPIRENEGITDADKISSLPPYRSGMWAKRSARIFLTPV